MGGCPDWGPEEEGLEGWGPEGWNPERWGAKISRIFSLSRHNFHSSLPSLGGLFVEFWL